MAIRRALGAGQNRLTRQLLTESLILSLLGGIAGVGTLFVAKESLLRLMPETLPRLNQISISWSVLIFALLTSILSGIIFGLAPALQARRLDLIRVLNQEGRASTGSGEQARTRRILVVTEFALSLVLMTSAGLLLHSFWDLLNVRLGFNPQSVMSIRTRMPYPNDVKIDKYATAAQEAPFVRHLLRRCRSLPGVEEVALGDPASIPLDQSQRELNVLEGKFFLTSTDRERNRMRLRWSKGRALRRSISISLEFRCDAAGCLTSSTWTARRKLRLLTKHLRTLSGLTRMRSVSDLSQRGLIRRGLPWWA